MTRRLAAILLLLTLLVWQLAEPEHIAIQIAGPDTARDSQHFISCLNKARVHFSDGSYVTCRIHNLPEGEHL